MLYDFKRKKEEKEEKKTLKRKKQIVTGQQPLSCMGILKYVYENSWTMKSFPVHFFKRKIIPC